MKKVNVEELDQDQGFRLRMEVALRESALKIRERSNEPGKFDSYIAEREKIIRDLIGSDAQLVYQGKIIFP